MERLVYLSVRVGCAAYLLYKVWEQKKKVRELCDPVSYTHLTLPTNSRV